MFNKKCFGAVLLAAAAVSSTAMASDRGVNTAVGAVVGAAIGHSAGGRDGAIVGGVIGAALGNSVSTRDDRRYYDNRGYASVQYYQPAPVYVEQPRPVYVEQRHYHRPEVVVIHKDRGHRKHRGYRHGYERGYDDGYNRGHRRGHRDRWNH